jgi:hypothetical protein
MAAGSTYTPIATTTASGSTSTITFNSFTGYTDLVLVFEGNSTNAGSSANSLRVRLNSDTGSNYSYTYLAGNGSSASSGRASNATNWDAMDIAQASARGMVNMYFMNYSNATTYKTMLSRSSVAAVETLTAVNLWRNTNAITAIEVYISIGNFSSGSTFTLYGIAAA